MTNVAASDSLFLTEVSLCDADPPTAPGACSLLSQEWQRTGVQRVEVPLRFSSSACIETLRDAGAPISVRCGPSPDEVLGSNWPGVVGVTLWIDSAASLARRQAGLARPPSALKLREAVEIARACGLETTVAFPLEMDRLRTLQNFGYLIQSFGVDRMRLVEQNGATQPLDLFRTLRALRERLSIPIEVDIDNTWGVAIGAVLCAIRAGVRHIAVSAFGSAAVHHVPLALLRGATNGRLDETVEE